MCSMLTCLTSETDGTQHINWMLFLALKWALTDQLYGSTLYVNLKDLFVLFSGF